MFGDVGLVTSRASSTHYSTPQITYNIGTSITFSRKIERSGSQTWEHFDYVG